MAQTQGVRGTGNDLINGLPNYGPLVAAPTAAPQPPNVAIAGTTDLSFQEKSAASYLQLNFYEPDNAVPRKKYILFWGNVLKIDESTTANYATYSPLSRSSQLFSYTGTQSRSFRLSYSLSKKDILSVLLNPETVIGGQATINLIKKNNSSTPNPQNSFFQTQGLTPDNVLNNRKGLKGYYEAPLDPDEVDIFIDSQIQLVRSLTLNNAKFPTQGPPLVRLNYGILYQDVPCICTDYSITPYTSERSLRDPITFMPNDIQGITINISLKEIRTGDYLRTDFTQFGGQSSDNLVGWEQLFNPETGSFDPISPLFKQ